MKAKKIIIQNILNQKIKGEAKFYFSAKYDINKNIIQNCKFKSKFLIIIPKLINSFPLFQLFHNIACNNNKIINLK